MIDADTYRARRDQIRKSCDGGIILFPGNLSIPRNYRDNVYPFRQNSHLLYFTGISRPSMALVVLESGDILFGTPEHADDVIWHGPHETLNDAAAKPGVDDVRDINSLGEFLQGNSGPVRYLPPFMGDVTLWMSKLLGLEPARVTAGADERLMSAVADLRNVKTADEIAEMETAHTVTLEQHLSGFRAVRPGIRESDVYSAALGPSLAAGFAQSFNPIVTVHGEVLHNESYGNLLESGQLLIHDSGLESATSYCTDITRTCPVDGRFTPKQRDIYEVVLRAQNGAIEKIAPGVTNRDVHLTACRIIAEGLCDLGLMRGSPESAVEAGAHALFMPHGIGHMIGLDVHDMEDLGDVVGYEKGEVRSTQFGLNYLRLARTLKEGFCVTIEPGIYFIEALFERWRGEGLHGDFIDYAKVAEYQGFGGIRIEDDILVTSTGRQVLGPGIPKTPEDVEAAMAGAA